MGAMVKCTSHLGNDKGNTERCEQRPGTGFVCSCCGLVTPSRRPSKSNQGLWNAVHKLWITISDHPGTRLGFRHGSRRASVTACTAWINSTHSSGSLNEGWHPARCTGTTRRARRHRRRKDAASMNNDELEFEPDTLPNDDPDIVAGMWRREWLRSQSGPPSASKEDAQ